MLQLNANVYDFLSYLLFPYFFGISACAFYCPGMDINKSLLWKQTSAVAVTNILESKFHTHTIKFKNPKGTMSDFAWN